MKSQQWISSFGPGPDGPCTPPPSLLFLAAAVRRPPPPPTSPENVPASFFEEYSFVLISSGLLVQPDEGVSDLVVDRIGVTTAIYREEPGS
ncbi:hypothetical protein F511_29003 [Dorcoceras hygrometricum]|uniref:Uncharacterized protein n=1 Tax=Dorcoceras hygrometricum TaxID=472368 RepID=A0A2Z7D1Z0_9LAMI|nr:hypothetical protein F511_29003 [Dorcoceras hygrometricum]